MPSNGRRSSMTNSRNLFVLVAMAISIWPSSARLLFNVVPVQLENGEPGLNLMFSFDGLHDTPANVTIHVEATVNIARDGNIVSALEDLAEIIGPIQPVLLINGEDSRPDPLRTARGLFSRTLPRMQLHASPPTAILVPLCDELTKVTLAKGIHETPTINCFPPSTLLTLRTCSRVADSTEDFYCETRSLETPDAIAFAPRDFTVVTNSTHSFTVAWSAPLTSIPVGVDRNPLDHFQLYVLRRPCFWSFPAPCCIRWNS